MKIHPTLFAGAAFCVAMLTPSFANPFTEGMEEGNPKLKSAGVLTFGPEGILFVADPQDASIVALAIEDEGASETGAASLKIEDVGAKLAALLGSSADQVLVEDLAANPKSGSVYLSVSRGRGPDAAPVLVRVSPEGELSVVSLDAVKFSKITLTDAPEDKEEGEGNRRRNPRRDSITDIGYYDGRLVIAGMANEEFASSLRSVEFPFSDDIDRTSVEIYHAAHGKSETDSPIRTFIPMEIEGEVNIIASYICTPLVRFPVAKLEGVDHLNGVTIGELGNRNRPLDMVEYRKDDARFILMANSSRGVMKIKADGLESVEAITEPVRGGGTEGVEFSTIEDWKGVTQLDRLNDQHAVVLQEGEEGSLTLAALAFP